MKTIERYIQFAIDNWLNEFENFKILRNTWITFDVWNCWLIWEVIYFYRKWYSSYCKHLKDLITSKEFIEAVARGIFDDEELLKKFSLYYTWDEVYFLDRSLDENLKNLENEICKLQALAVRDNKLEDFINNLLTK